MQTYTVKQVADILGYSTNSIYTFLKENRIKGVRVGKGRFRISEDELNRLLQLAKKAPLSPSNQTETPFNPPSQKTGSNNQSSVTQSSPGMVEQIIELPTEPVFQMHQNHDIRILIPSLFDWFLGIASILVGSSMFLLNGYLEEYNFGPYLPWISPIRISLIAAGVGILLVDVLGKAKSLWDRIFHIILLLSYAAFSLILLVISDYDGFTMFALASLTQVASLFVGMGTVATFTLFASLFLLFVPVALVLKTPSVLPPSFLSVFQSNVTISTSIWIGIGLLFILLMWWSYYRARIVFFLSCALSILLLVCLSVFYGSTLFWGRAFFLLFMAICMLFAPLWPYLRLAKQKDRMIIFVGHGLVLLIFLSAIGIVRLIQNNTLTYIRQQLDSKVQYGRVLIETSFDSMKETLESSGTNSTLIDAIVSGKTDLVSGIARNIFEGNRNFQRVMILNSSGELQAIYPPIPLDATNFASREYFSKAMSEKKTYISDLFPTNTAEDSFTIVISTPVGATTAGVLVGSVDLDYLGVRLQQIANTAQQEYFIVADKNGKLMLHPDSKLVNTQIDDSDILRNALQGKKGNQGYNDSGVYVVESYDSLPVLGWAIAAIQPITAALGLTNTTAFVVFYVMLASVIVLGSVVWFRSRLKQVPKDT